MTTIQVAPRLSNFFCEIDTRLGHKDGVTLFSVSQLSGVIPKNLIGFSSEAPQNFEKYKVVQKGDLVLNRFNAYRGALGVAPGLGIVSPDYAVLRKIGLSDIKFFDYWLRSDPISNAMKATMGGLGANDPDSSGFSRISLKELLRLQVSIDDERRRIEISQYLDQETSQIDLLISKKEQLIENLLERRQALIAQVVTKGLDPNVPMKDSGVEWLGEVPEAWEILPPGVIFRSSSTKGSEQDVHLTPSQKLGVLPQADYMALSGSRVVLQSTESGNMKLVLPGDFISHLRSFQGGLEISNFRGKVSGAYTVLRPVKRMVGQYFKWLLKSSLYVQGLQTTTDQLRDGQTLRMAQLRLLRLPFPSLGEQETIASYLDKETSQIDTLVEKTRKAIELLKERRQALITQVVNGKIDVRGFTGGNS